MERRQFLTLAGGGASFSVVGCIGGDENDGSQSSNDSNNGSKGEPTDSNESEEETGNTTNGEPNLVNHGHELVTNESESPSIAVEYEVENNGDGVASFLEVKIDWYNADGDYIETDEQSAWVLEPRETWLAYIPAYSRSGQEDEIDDYELSGTFQRQDLSPAPEELTVTETDLLVGDRSAEVRATVEHEGEEAYDFIEAIPRIFDSDGNFLRDTYTNVENFEPGDEWAIALTVTDTASRLEAMDNLEIRLSQG